MESNEYRNKTALIVYGGWVSNLTRAQRRALAKANERALDECFTADDLGEHITTLFNLCKRGHLKCFNMRPQYGCTPLYIKQCTLKFKRVISDE
jgi:hypothetical protein